jgi:hypothetical protein
LGKPSKGKTKKKFLNIDSTMNNNASLQERTDEVEDPSQTLD